MIEKVYLSANRTFFGQIHSVHCEEGFIFSDRTTSKKTVCYFNNTRNSLEWSELENVSCIPNSCLPPAEVYTEIRNRKKFYSVGEQLKLNCLNEYVINLKCVLSEKSRVADWNQNASCRDLCPREWIHSSEDGFCYSLPSSRTATFLGALFQCDEFYYLHSQLLSLNGPEDLNTFTTLAVRYNLKIQTKIWFSYNFPDAALSTLTKYTKDSGLDNSAKTICPVLIISNSSWEVGFENCSSFNYFSCRIRAAECPPLNETLLTHLNLQYGFVFKEDGSPPAAATRTVGTHNISCILPDYRLPLRALEAKGPRSALQRLRTDASFQILSLYNNQELKCVEKEGGVPEWSYSQLVACEPRNCSVTEEMRSSPFLTLSLYKRTVWEGRPDGSTPEYVPIGITANYSCANGKEITSICGQTGAYDAAWSASFDSLVICEKATDLYLLNGRCLKDPEGSKSHSWEDAGEWCIKQGRELPKPDSLLYVNELDRHLKFLFEYGLSIWLGFSTTQPESIEYLANRVPNLQQFLDSKTIQEIMTFKESQYNPPSARCLVMKREKLSHQLKLFFDHCELIPKDNRFTLCDSRSATCPEFNLNNSVRSANEYFNGSERELKCRNGFTRTEAKKDRVVCLVRSQKLQWIGKVQDCEVNFCDPPDSDLVHSRVLNRTFAFPPENETATSGKYYENATRTIECIQGFLFQGESIAKQKCTFDSTGIGRGRWIPERIECLPVKCADPNSLLKISDSTLKKTKTIDYSGKNISQRTLKYLYGDEITFRCDEGYIFTSQKVNQSYRCEQMNRTGEWLLIGSEKSFGCIAMSPQREVYNFLMKQLTNSSYLPQFRPRKNYLTPVSVHISFQLVGLRSLQEGGTMETSANLVLIWNDEFLIWQDIENIQFYKDFPIQVPKSLIWFPEFAVKNGPGGVQFVEIRNGTLCNVYYQGNVSVAFSQTFTTECELDVTRFPFDDQECKIELIFPGFSYNEVHWSLPATEEKELELDENYAWSVDSKGCEQKISNFTMPFSVYFGNPSELEYSQFRCVLKLKRNPTTASFYVVIPTLAITVFNMMSFLLPSGEDGKVGMNTNTFLSFVMLQGIINAIVPTNSMEVPVLAKYVCSSV